MNIYIDHARLIDARGERPGGLRVSGGQIVPGGKEPGDTVINARGMALMPAFVDTHCHLRDPGYPDKETMETGMRAALAGGYAALCAMANTCPACDTAERVTQNLEKARALRLCRLIQAGAAGLALSDETPSDWRALARVTPVISNDGHSIVSETFMARLLRASSQYGFIVSTHCQPERALIKRDIALARREGGRLHVGHISRRESAALIAKAKQEGLSVTCEVMPHHLFDANLSYRVNPPFRTREDVEALTQAVLNGTVDCLATDHAPHTEADKAGGAAGISNIEHAAAIFHTVLAPRGLTLARLSALMSLQPARLLGLKGGLLTAGAPADLVLFNPEERWVLRRESMISRSHNTPFEGREVMGRVVMTMVDGQILYQRR